MTENTKKPVRDVIDKLDELSGHEELTVGKMLDAFGRTSFLPVMMVPAVLVVSPLSGIPLFSSICGLTIALVAVQMLFMRDHIWLPAFVQRRTVKGERLHNAMAKLERLANWIDRISRRRWSALVVPPGNRLPQIVCLVAGLMMPFLELVPFSSSILGLCVLCCGAGLLARDGLFVLMGCGLFAVASVIPYFVVTTVAGL